MYAMVLTQYTDRCTGRSACRVHSAVFLVWTEGSTTDANPACSALSSAITVVNCIPRCLAKGFPDQQKLLTVAQPALLAVP